MKHFSCISCYATCKFLKHIKKDLLKYSTFMATGMKWNFSCYTKYLTFNSDTNSIFMLKKGSFTVSKIQNLLVGEGNGIAVS